MILSNTPIYYNFHFVLLTKKYIKFKIMFTNNKQVYRSMIITIK